MPRASAPAAHPINLARRLAKLQLDPANVGTRFDGYTSRAASLEKILHNVFEPGDAWFRTGDLMRRDEKGYFYFVDRLGDTFRRKGENVATIEVAEAICACPESCTPTYSVSPFPESKDASGWQASNAPIRRSCRPSSTTCPVLPHYARPVFLRIRQEVELTGTLKYSKTQLVREGYDPAISNDALYFDTVKLSSAR